MLLRTMLPNKIGLCCLSSKGGFGCPLLISRVCPEKMRIMDIKIHTDS
jgi:hypothetical protein